MTAVETSVPALRPRSPISSLEAEARSRTTPLIGRAFADALRTRPAHRVGRPCASSARHGILEPLRSSLLRLRRRARVHGERRTLVGWRRVQAGIGPWAGGPGEAAATDPANAPVNFIRGGSRNDADRLVATAPGFTTPRPGDRVAMGDACFGRHRGRAERLVRCACGMGTRGRHDSVGWCWFRRGRVPGMSLCLCCLHGAVGRTGPWCAIPSVGPGFGGKSMFGRVRHGDRRA